MNDITIQNNFENSLTSIIKGTQAPKDMEASFGGALKEAITRVDRIQKEADQAVEGLATGEKKDIHQTMIALEKAEVSFKLMMQVRNKIIDAYEEVMHMHI